MSIHCVMRISPVSLRIIPLLFIATVHPSCQSKQEDAPKPPPPAASASHVEPGILELPEGSPTLADLQTERVALRRSGPLSKPKPGRFWPMRIDWHTSAQEFRAVSWPCMPIWEPE